MSPTITDNPLMRLETVSNRGLEYVYLNKITKMCLDIRQSDDFIQITHISSEWSPSHDPLSPTPTGLGAVISRCQRPRQIVKPEEGSSSGNQDDHGSPPNRGILLPAVLGYGCRCYMLSGTPTGEDNCLQTRATVEAVRFC